MSTTRDIPDCIAVTPVRAERQQDFERFVTDVIVPAGRKARPHLEGQWQLLRPHPEADGCDYMFVFYGGVPLDDWELDQMFTDAYGSEESTRLLAQFEELVSGEQQVYQFNGDNVGGR